MRKKHGWKPLGLNLIQLETFIWVATLGSFRKTAERLYTTQPAVSSRIANLEETLGVKLFERTTGAVRLSAKGQELLPYAEKVLRLAENLRERAGERSRLAGILRLGVSETIVHTWLPLFLRRLHDVHPEVDVDITVDVTTNLRHQLLGRSLDLAFLMGPISEFSIVNLELSAFPLIWVASPELGIGHRQSMTLPELRHYPLLTYARDTRPYAELARYIQQNSDTPARIFPSSSLAACLRMTIDGVGIGILPLTIVADMLKTGVLVELDCLWTPADLRFTASFPASPFNPVSEKAAALACEVAHDYPG